jgi:crotonyl-CoA reductase
VDDIRNAILSGELSALASLPVPATYEAVVVRADEVGMFDGLATKEKDPR